MTDLQKSNQLAILNKVKYTVLRGGGTITLIADLPGYFHLKRIWFMKDAAEMGYDEQGYIEFQTERMKLDMLEQLNSNKRLTQ